MDKFILATCVLHNFVLKHRGLRYTIDRDAHLRDGTWRREVRDAVMPIGARQYGHMVALDVKCQQNNLKDWFNGIGRVAWQEDAISTRVRDQ